MSRFIQDGTGVIVSVADEKDERFVAGWKPVGPEEKTTVKRSPKK